MSHSIGPACDSFAFLASASASASVGSGVLCGELVTVNAMRLSGVDSASSYAAHEVHEVRDCFEIVWLDAGVNTAEMIEFEASRHISVEDNPEPAMCPDWLAASIEPAISVAIDRARPEPATGVIKADVIEETLKGRARIVDVLVRLWAYAERIARLFPAAIVQFAPATGYERARTGGDGTLSEHREVPFSVSRSRTLLRRGCTHYSTHSRLSDAAAAVAGSVVVV